MIKQLLVRSLRFLQLCMWRIQKFAIPPCSDKLSELCVSDEQKILVIAPHADDELIGCHELIRQNLSNIKVVYCSMLGHNYTESNRLIREGEFISYMDYMGADYTILQSDNLPNSLERLVSDFKPSIIALPSYVDWHEEHRKVNEILQECSDAIPDNTLIGWYHISLPLPFSHVSAFSKMTSKQQRIKWSCLSKYYKSQLNIDVRRFKFVERLYKADGNFAEAYMILGKAKWLEAINKLSEKQEEIDKLKQTLGNIEKMFSETGKVYMHI